MPDRDCAGRRPSDERIGSGAGLARRAHPMSDPAFSRPSGAYACASSGSSRERRTDAQLGGARRAAS
ncbi:hypothetical protein C6T52_03040 [Burkholderia multivorans]|nr:hypothetical protein C6T52_03040 [Burkholderia multivorans]